MHLREVQRPEILVITHVSQGLIHIHNEAIAGILRSVTISIPVELIGDELYSILEVGRRLQRLGLQRVGL